MIDALPLLLSDEGYQISRSVRFRSSASASFTRTPASAGNRKTWTWSGWVKRGALGSTSSFFGLFFGANNSSQFYVMFNASNQLEVGLYTVSALVSTAVFRDPSAWYHIAFAFDSTQATAANRLRLYVNGNEITAFATDNRSTFTQNGDFAVNAAQAHYLGYNNVGGFYFDGYMTEVNFIDGYPTVAGVTYNATTWAALNVATLFGETNPVTGVWQPKKYTGTYGTNGFYLNFSNNSAATAAAIGADYSGNGNNWTPNNISVTAGATYDSMLDVPTQWADGGNGRGNYATLNPLWASDAAGNTYSYANLILDTNGSSSAGNARCTIALPSSGKFYCEMKPTNFVCSTSGTSIAYYGILAASSAKQIAIRTISSASSSLTGSSIFKDGVSQGAITTLSLNDILGFAIDCGAGTVQIFVNNTSVYSGNYSVTSEPYFFGFSGDSGTADRNSTTEFNFGQRPFTYTPPTGFKALNTLNLPQPTILKGNQYFDATTYTGNGGALTVTNSGGMQPDLIWVKPRSVGNFHAVWDSVRGGNNLLYPNGADIESASTNLNMSVNSSGWSMNGNNSSFNPSGATIVGWQWKEGPTQGFDIVTYTGTGANRTVSHSLGVAPSMIIIKNRGTVVNWAIWHNSFPTPTTGLIEFTTGAVLNSATYWNSTTPTSSVFSLGSYVGVNENTKTHVAYLFSEVAGYSRFGSYTGNGSADGPFVFCGFRPRFVLLKNTSVAGTAWYIFDTARDTYNVAQNMLYPNASTAETVSNPNQVIDVLSNGFKIRATSSGWDNNNSGNTIIFAAFAESPFKNSLAR